MTVTYQYFPYQTGSGAQVTQDKWNKMFKWMRTNGILTENTTLNSSTDDLAVTAGTGLQVQVAQGKAFIEGTFFLQDGNYTELAISPNSSGDDRIDLVVLTADFVAKTTTLEVLEGTPAMSPVAPTPQQDTDAWQFPLAEVYVADGAMSIVSMDITDERVISVQGSGGGPGDSVCVVYQSTDQSLGNGMAGASSFNSTIYDPSSMHSDSVENNKIHILEDGIYLITASIVIVGDSMATGNYTMNLIDDNGDYIGIATTVPNVTGGKYSLELTRIVNASAGDWFYIYVNNQTGATINYLGSSSLTDAEAPVFSAVKLG